MIAKGLWGCYDFTRSEARETGSFYGAEATNQKDDWQAGKAAGAPSSNKALACRENLPRTLAGDSVRWKLAVPATTLDSPGKLPIYSCLSTIDNCNFADETLWKSEAVRYAHTFTSEGGHLKVASGSYDCMIASHCLEHMANPIRTLLEWKRVLGKDGMLL